MLPVVVHLDRRRLRDGLIVILAAGLEVALEQREIAAGNLNPELVSEEKIIAGDNAAQLHAIDLPRNHEPGLVDVIAIAQAGHFSRTRNIQISIERLQARSQVSPRWSEPACAFFASRERNRG